MELKEYFSPATTFHKVTGKTKATVLKHLSQKLAEHGYAKDEQSLLKALEERESQITTAIGEGVAVPHTQSDAVLKPVVAVATLADPVDWGAPDEKPVTALFVIALPTGDASAQIGILQGISSMILNDETAKQIKTSGSAKELYEAVQKGLIAAAAANEAVESVPEEPTSGKKFVVAVTACPTGIAHTFLAADAIKKAAAEMGLAVKVETQGRSVENKLTQAEIDRADAIILAIDKGIDGMDRFAGKKVLNSSAKAAIHKAPSLIERALKGEGELAKGASSAIAGASDLQWKNFKFFYKNLMGGVSRMLPFVVAGGVILGLGFLMDSGITGGDFGVTRDVSRWFSGLGKTAFTLFVPVLGGFVAYSIVGTEGLLPGFIAGFIANGGGILYQAPGSAGPIDSGWNNLWGSLTLGVDQSVLANGSGFIGAMVGGYLAAVIVMVLRKYVFFKVHKALAGAVSIVGMPVLSTLGIGVIMFTIQIPLGYLQYGLQLGLSELNDLSLGPVLALIIGIMSATDFGGPINKVAYVFSTSLLGLATTDAYKVMGMDIAANMTPPIACAMATVIARKRWTYEEFSAGQADWLMGAFMITEGAIPFAAKDPKRVIPCLMVGSAVAAIIVAALQVGISAPHGGVFTFALLRSYLFDETGLQIGLGVAFMVGSIGLGALISAFLINLTGGQGFHKVLVALKVRKPAPKAVTVTAAAA